MPVEATNKDRMILMERDIKTIMVKLDRLTKMVEMMLEEDEIPIRQTNVTQVEEDGFIGDEEIMKFGQRIPYNRITNANDMDGFRDFVIYVQDNPGKFTSVEVDYARFSNKNFSDIRISDNARRILSQAYTRVHGQQWPFRFERGWMLKYKGNISWDWPND